MRFAISRFWVWKIGLLALVAVGAVSLSPASANAARKRAEITEDFLIEAAQNDVAYYNPFECVVKTDSGDDNGGGGTKLKSGRLKEVVESYGELSMDLQKEWGTPWEVVFAQMVVESNVGAADNSIAAAVAENGYYNWLGLTGSGGKYSVGKAYVDGSGRSWAQYKTIENMIKDWSGEYIARNGYYDEAYKKLDPNNYDLDGFLKSFISVYAPESDGNDPTAYFNMVKGLIDGTIEEVRKAKKWPTSAELAKEEKIAIGGKHPIGKTGSDDGGDEEDSDGGGCVKLTGSPDYDSDKYKEKIKKLHDLNQRDGVFNNKKMCINSGSYISEGGCGIMSLYAAYSMFSNNGWTDEKKFEELLGATMSDGYNAACGSSDTSQYGKAITDLTEMSGETVMIEDRYSGDHWDLLVDELEKGHKIIINVIGADGSYFTGGGHYMMLDHYNKEKDMIFMFDPYLNEGTVASVESTVKKGDDIEYDNFRDGIYLSRKAMDAVVKPRRALVLTYNGCYDGGSGGGDECDGGGNGNLKSGGMTFEEAKQFMAKYRAEASKGLFGHYGSGYANGAVIGDGWVNDASCNGGTLNNCSAFSQWFVNNYTSAGPTFTSTAGSEYANTLVTSGGFEDGGQTPQVYAIFSEGSGTGSGDGCSDPSGAFHSNHTGVILGIDKENNKVYTGEAACGNGYTGGSSDFTGYTEEEANGIWPGVHVHTLDSMTNSGTCGYTYAYPGDKLQIDSQKDSKKKEKEDGK